MSSVKRIDFLNPEAPSLFLESLKDTGFAVIENHPIDRIDQDAVYEDWESFFGHEHKMMAKTEDGIEGYFPFKSENAKDSPVKDLKEFYHFYNVEKLPIHTPPTIYMRAMLNDMASILLDWIQKELPTDVSGKFSEPLPKMIENTNQTLFRILHYPPLLGDVEEGAVRAAAHEDINLITILPAATQPGLEVLAKDGSWFKVECDPGALIVNVGDMLDLACGGYLKSTTHRVVNPLGEAANRSRYSMPLFLHPRPEVMLSKEKSAEQYLTERLRELGLIK